MAYDHSAGSRYALLGFYSQEDAAESALRQVMDADFPMDRVSILGKANASGDDPLGVYYANAGERMKGWGKLGAFWGGLWGGLTGAAGIFLVPGVGPLLAAGPLVQALAGAAGGAGVGGATMAGAAAASQLSVAIHRMGVPDEAIEEVQSLLDQGRVLLLMIVKESELSPWRERLEKTHAERLMTFPYTGYTDALRQAV